VTQRGSEGVVLFCKPKKQNKTRKGRENDKTARAHRSEFISCVLCCLRQSVFQYCVCCIFCSCVSCFVSSVAVDTTFVLSLHRFFFCLVFVVVFVSLFCLSALFSYLCVLSTVFSSSIYGRYFCLNVSTWQSSYNSRSFLLFVLMHSVYVQVSWNHTYGKPRKFYFRNYFFGLFCDCLVQFNTHIRV